MEQLPNVNITPEEAPVTDYQDPEGAVSIGTPLPKPELSPDVIEKRAQKIGIGVGRRLHKSVEDIKKEILDGRENTLREMAASDYNTELSQNRYNQLVDLANRKGSPLTEDEARRVMDPFNPLNRNTQPDTVVEKEYAHKYIMSLGDAIDTYKTSPVAEAIKEDPDMFAGSFLKGSELTFKMEFYNKLVEEAQAIMSKQSAVKTGTDVIKTMFQPYVEARMRGLNEETGYFAGGPGIGGHLEATADHVFNLPGEASAKEARRIFDGLKDNPQLALRWAEYLKGLPTSERVLDSAFTYMMPLDYAAMVKGGVNMGRAVSVNRRANQAIRQLVEKADEVGTSTAAKQEATGDLGAAAATRSGDNISAAVAGKGDPLKIATEDTLLTFLNQGKTKIAEGKPVLSNEGVRRIQDQYDATGKSLLQRLTDAVRINRMPMPLAVQEAVQVLKQATRDSYPAIRNAIQDISDPIYEGLSNTYWFRITIGNFDGTLFSNEKTAQNFAKLHGIDAKIIEERGVVTTKEMQALYDKRTQLQRDLLTVDDNIARNRAKMDDVSLPEKDRIAAREQADLFTQFKRDSKKELEGIDLSLKGEKVKSRVEALRNEASLLQAQNKETRKRLRDTASIQTESKDRQFARTIMEDTIKSNSAVVRANLQEARAIVEGKADVIGANPDTVIQHGVGFKLQITRPLNETDRAVRDLMIKDVNGKFYPEAVSIANRGGLQALVNATVGKLRGADDTLALNESIQRKIGTYTQSIFKEWAQQEAGYIRQIASGVIRTDPVTGQPISYLRAKPQAIYDKITGKTKQRFNEFERTLDHARDAVDPDTGKKGYFFQTPGELQDHYQRFFHRDPSFAEHEGYFAFVRMVEGDRILREIAEFRNRARLGVEQFQLSARSGKESVSSGFFDGRIRKEFPGGDDVMLIMSRRIGDEKIVNLGGAGIPIRKLEEYRDLVKQGRLKVIEVYAPEHKPLNDFSPSTRNEYVRYILTDAAESKPIEFNHVNRRGGGHFEYDYDHYIKQAKYEHQYENLNGVRSKFKSVYTGDTTFMPILNRVMGRDIVRHITEVQQLIKSGDLKAAETYTRANLPIEWDELHGMFRGGTVNGKATRAVLDLNEPFHIVPNGMTVRDVDHQGMIAKYGNTWKDAERSGSLNRQFQVQFNTERESFKLNHLEDIGTQGNPVYKYAPTARMIDPITTMNKALNRIVNTVFMDDYKIYAVEHWLREAEPFLEPVRAALARSSPNWVMQSSLDKSAFLPGAPREIVDNLLNNRYKIQQFIGVPSKVDTAIQTAKQHLVDAAYAKHGPNSKTEIVANYLLDKVKDPFTFMRSMTFHEKLGLFNPAQLLVQMQTFANIIAISPKQGMSSTLGTMLYSWSRLNRSPEVLAHMDSLASKMLLPGQAKWKPGQFLEAVQSLERTGFDRVAGEYANLNTALKTDFVGNDFKSFLNAGTFFFREGERSSRVGAFFTAYKEFRELRPTGALSRDDLGKILQRADLLSVNMSRASNSALNNGFLSLTTQFLTYQIRQAELFMGNRIDAAAKMRLFLFYSALYGAPSAVGLTGLPMSDAIRKEAIQRGYIVGDNWMSTALDQGLPAVMGAIITGGGDFRKGNNYNFGSRLGSPGFTGLRDAMKSDNTFWQILGGASGTALMNTVASTNNFFHAMASQFFGSNKDRPFPLKMDDFIDVFKEISSVNQSWKLITAINTQKWLSKNEGYVGDVTKANAAFMAVFGFSPQQQEDAFLKNDLRKEAENYQKYVMRESIKEIRRAYQDRKDNNEQSYREHMTRATTLMEASGFPQRRIADVLSMAAKGYETTINAGDYQFTFSDKTPSSRSTFMGVPTPFTTQSNIEATRQDQYRSQLRLNKEKAQ